VDLGFCREKNAFCAEGATQSLTLVPWVHNFYVPKPYTDQVSFSVVLCHLAYCSFVSLSLSCAIFLFKAWAEITPLFLIALRMLKVTRMGKLSC
jgi:hypothetical protein